MSRCGAAHCDPAPGYVRTFTATEDSPCGGCPPLGGGEWSVEGPLAFALGETGGAAEYIASSPTRYYTIEACAVELDADRIELNELCRASVLTCRDVDAREQERQLARCLDRAVEDSSAECVAAQVASLRCEAAVGCADGGDACMAQRYVMEAECGR